MATSVLARGFRRQVPSVAAPLASQSRSYRHWFRVKPEDFELPIQSMPDDMKKVLNSKPDELSFVESYWRNRIKAESTLLDPENLVKKSYRDLALDMGFPIVTEPEEHSLGLVELYEYLKSSPFLGPFGTIENPVVVPSVFTERVVGCTGGIGDDEHVPLYFRCREGFLYRCAECDQIFMLARITFEHTEEEMEAIEKIEADYNDVFDWKLLEKGNKMWNGDTMAWSTGYQAMEQSGMIPKEQIQARLDKLAEELKHSSEIRYVNYQRKLHNLKIEE
jgi:cytochrome c oxidase subunit 5b